MHRVNPHHLTLSLALSLSLGLSLALPLTSSSPVLYAEPTAESEPTAQPNAEPTAQSNAESTAQPNAEPQALTEEQLEALVQGSDDEARERALWIEFKRYAALYLEGAQEQRELNAAVFKDLYRAQQQRVEDRYERPIKDASDLERTQRVESIKRFKSFLEGHPPHPQYTPDSLYRLAMLLLEEVDAEFLDRMEVYRERLETASEDEELAPPQRDHRQVISAFTRLINDWPNYRDLDGAYYARAHSYLEMGEEQTALRDFQTIIKRFPQSEYRTEVWNLIGELHFRFAELPQAIRAYSEVLKDESSQYYMPAYYKLAWTYYRNDQFEEAVETFKRLITYSDKQTAEGKPAFELRAEAIQYLAISLNEDDWDDDGMIDSGAGYKRVQRYVKGGESYQAELLESLVNIFFETSKYEDSIKVARLLFKQHPFYHNNPLIHAKVISAYERIAQIDRAFAARDELNDAYIISGPWYAANHKDQKAIDASQGLMKDSLLQAGTYHHERAQLLRQRALESELASERDALLAQAKRSYNTAASSYQRYLARYPKDENTYELLYLVADALYFSEDYAGALAQYIVVRDSKLGEEHKEEAAFSAILAQMEVLKGAVARGELASKPWLGEEQRAQSSSDQEAPKASEESAEGAPPSGPKKITPEDLPTLTQQALTLRQEYLDADLKNDEDPERVPVMIYKVGEIYLDYRDLPKARERFEQLIKEFPRSSVAEAAAAALIETFRLEEDWPKMAEWAERIAQAGLGEAVVSQAKLWKVGALYKTAQRLFDQKKYAEAAQEYLSLVDQNPDNEFAAAALNNGAVAFERARMFDSAMKTYERIYREFENSEFSENALFRVAFNAERFYNYDKAVVTFSELARRYPKGEHAADAAFNAARLLEQTQQYKQAAKAYEALVKRYPDREDAAQIFLGAATCYERLNDNKSALRIYNAFIKRFGDDPKHNKLIITSLAKSLDIYKRYNNKRAVNKTQERIIKEYAARELPPGIYEARYPAQARFEQIEGRFERFLRLKIAGSLRNQGKVIKTMKEEIAGLTEAYSELLSYKSLDWTIAAFYRIGLLRQLFAKALYNVPMPPGLSPEEEDIYITQIEELAIPIEDDAVLRFETAYQKAREFRISNEWTRKILLSLNQYKGADLQSFKDEKRLEVRELFTTSQLLLPKAAQELLTPQDDAQTTAPSNEASKGTSQETAPQGEGTQGEAQGEAQGASESTSQPSSQGEPTLGAKKPKRPPSPSPQKDSEGSAEELEIEEVELSPGGTP